MDPWPGLDELPVPPRRRLSAASIGERDLKMFSGLVIAAAQGRHRGAVERRHCTTRHQESQQHGNVTEPDECLGMAVDEIGIQQRQDAHGAIPTTGADDAVDGRIGKQPVNQVRPLLIGTGKIAVGGIDFLGHNDVESHGFEDLEAGIKGGAIKGAGRATIPSVSPEASALGNFKVGVIDGLKILFFAP